MNFELNDDLTFASVPAGAWRGCDPAPGRPAGRFGAGLLFAALALAGSAALLESPLPLDPRLPVLTLACALGAALLLWLPTRRLCRVTAQRQGIDVVWRVARNGFSPARFFTDRRAWDEVRALEKLHTPDDGESGERWEVQIDVSRELLDGRLRVSLSFDDEARLDAWLAAAQNSRERHDGSV